MNKEFTDFENKLIGRVKAAAERLDSVDRIEDLSPKITIRRVKLSLEPRKVKPEEVKNIRHDFHVSQAVFAKLIGVSKRTLEKWEQGKSEVPGPAAVLLGDMIANPDHWKSKFSNMMVRTKQRS
jgi:putative transcriptional regulator